MLFKVKVSFVHSPFTISVWHTAARAAMHTFLATMRQLELPSISSDVLDKSAFSRNDIVAEHRQFNSSRSVQKCSLAV